jgi:uncharacterized membrane protein YqjE
MHRLMLLSTGMLFFFISIGIMTLRFLDIDFFVSPRVRLLCIVLLVIALCLFMATVFVAGHSLNVKESLKPYGRTLAPPAEHNDLHVNSSLDRTH